MMNSIKLYITLIIVILGTVPVFSNAPVNPTGTYRMATKNGARTSGEIQVKQISKSRLVIILGVNIGAPSYNSGALIDTLTYLNKYCVYKGSADDPSCRITFKFSDNGILVAQRQDDLNAGCGFGHGVFAGGFYKKTSSKMPVLRNPQTGELIK